MTDAAPILPVPAPHPIVPFFSEAQIADLKTRPDGMEVYLAGLRAHMEAVAAAEWDEAKPLGTDPFRNGFKLPHWRIARWLLGLDPKREAARRCGSNALPGTAPTLCPELAEIFEDWKRTPHFQSFGPEMQAALLSLPEEVQRQMFFVWIGLGGNRATKSELCAWLTVETAVRVPGVTCFCVSETLATSRKTQQALIWKYLPLEIKKLNDKPDPRKIFKLSYTLSNGFGTAEPRVTLPNGSQLVFTTYNMEPAKQLEGVTLGSKRGRAVGMWLDESATTGWFDAGRRRARFSGAVVLWSFTPVAGMTPAIKQAVGEARTVQSFPSELLSQEVRHVADCPRGHVPYLAMPITDGAIVHYFPAQFNPFGTHAGTFYDAVKADCRNADGTWKASKYVLRIAHGYTEDVTGRAFPGFGARHIVTLAQVPARLTLYQFTDPHRTKPYATIWVGVTPGRSDECDYYILRDCPDEQRFGEWAVPTQRETNDETRKGWDGDPGPAAKPIGWGVARYKQEWLDLERIKVPDVLKQWEAGHGEETLDSLLKEHLAVPWHRPIVRQALLSGAELDELRETIHERFMDARFANAQDTTESDGLTTLARRFDEPHQFGGRILPRMFIRGIVGHGHTVEDGLPLVNDLLDWDKDADYIPRINAPRLFVLDSCKQVRWMFENYTTKAGEEGACKEWADLMRHLAKANPTYVEPGPVRTRGGGWGY